MKHSLVLALALVLVGAASLRAEDAAERERQFINGMRARGYSRLALGYLEKLSADPNLDAALKLSLPMEIARTRMSLAQESPLDQRQALYSRARADLEEFAKASQGRPTEVQANMEIARITAFQGKAQLSRAVRQETLAARINEAAQARILFEDAGKKLNQAVASLDAQMIKYKGSTKDEDVKTLDALKRDKLQAEFDQALNLLLQSQTYVLSPKDAETEKRGVLAQEAEKSLGEIGGREENNPLCLKAKVWLIPCFLTMSEPDKARDAYKDVSRIKPDENSLDARMLADYFHLALLTAPGSKVKKAGDQIRKEGTAWLRSKNLGSFGSTPEGYGVFIRIGNDFCFVPSSAADVKHAVQFELAKELIGEAKSAKTKALAAALYKAAQEYLNELQDTENDLTPKAQGLHLQVFIATRGGKINVDQLKTFRDLNFLARYNIERYRLAKGEAEQKARLRDVADALQRALNVTDAKVRRVDRVKAGIELTDVYLNLGDYHRAAIYGEYLARTYPESKDATRAAAFALQAYSSILRVDATLKKKLSGDVDPVLTDDVMEKVAEGDRQRFLGLAHFVGKQPSWQDEAVSQYARYQLAVMALQEKNYVEALPLLESIKPSWAGYRIARCQVVFTSMALTREDATRRSTGRVLGFDLPYRTPLSEEERKAYEQKALAAIKSLPELKARPTPEAVRYQLAASLEQCKILYREKKYAELEKVATALLQQLAKVPADIKLAEQVRDNLRLGLETWQKYAVVGLANQDYKAGKFDDVLARVGPLVAAVAAKVARAKEAKAKKEDIDPIKDFLLQRDILEVALRTYVEKNNIVDAKRTFDLLQDLATDPDLTGGPTAIKPTEILVSLVIQLKTRIQDLRLKGKAATAELDRTVANFSGFLDLLTRDMDKLVKQLDAMALGGQKSLKPQILALLAKSYASLDKNKEAGKLLAMIPRPQDPTLPVSSVAGVLFGGSGDIEAHLLWQSLEENRSWVETQVLLAQVLIKGKQLKEAQAVLGQKELKPQGKLSLDMIFLSLDVKKLDALLLEAKGDYRKAMAGWTTYQKDPNLKRLLGDRHFERMLERYKANDAEAMQKEIDRLPAARTPADVEKVKGKHADSHRRTKERLEKMYQDLVKLFFDAYYHKTYCVFKVSETVTKQSVKADWIKAAANLIVRLENAANKDGWNNTKDQFLILLENEPELKKKYEELKSAAK
jgi:hypothetical protein